MSQRKIGDYLVLNSIGHGSQATVYRVRDSRTGQIRALKELHPHRARDPYALERFRREAEMASRIHAPHVVPIFEVGRSANSHFIVMEYLPLTLRQILQDQGPLPIENAVAIALQICYALAAAWEVGIIHRDIKPSNVLMDVNGLVKVTDFGIARAADLPSITQLGAVVGTQQYMAPEQGQGLKVDIRSDLYSLGVLLYQMLSGRLPFEGRTTEEVLRKQLQNAQPSLAAVAPQVPTALAQVVEKLMAKDPDDRYQTPKDVILALEALGLPAPSSSIMPRLGDYALLEELGVGAQAVVYRALDLRSAQEVALKVPHRHLVETAADAERVLREASLAAGLQHPHVVRVLEYGQQDERCFIAMEYMPRSLRRLINEEGLLEESEALRIALDVCLGLEEAHRHGLVHRDIKPENILLTSDGRAKVADFGIARILTILSSRTATADTPGTARYMAPEQIRGEPADIRADLYALGLVLVELLTGKQLADAKRDQSEDVASCLKRHRPHLSQDVLRIVQKALADDQEQRYQQPHELRIALERALNTQAPEATILERPQRRWPRRPRWGVVAAAVIVLFIGVGAGGLALLWGSAPEATTPPSVELLGFSTTTEGPEGAVPAGGKLNACDPKVLVAWLSYRNLKPGETLNGTWSRNGLSRGAVKREVDEGTDTLFFSRPDPNLPGEYRFDLNRQGGEAEETLGSWNVEVTCTPSFQLMGFSNTSDSSEGLVPEGGTVKVCEGDRLTVWVAHRDLLMDTALLGKWYRDGTHLGDVPYEPPNPTDQIWFDLALPTPPDVYRFELHYENGGLIGAWDVNVTC
jgi:serine/threonine protein kinase